MIHAAFNGQRKLEQLPAAERENCLQQYRLELKTQLLPVFLQLAVLTNFIVSGLFVMTLVVNKGWYFETKYGVIYLLIIGTFFALIRLTRFRVTTPVNVYCFCLILMGWGLFMYVLTDGEVVHLRAIPLTLVFVGWFTLSIRHTALVWGLYLAFVYLAVGLAHRFDTGLMEVIKVTITWFIVTSFAISLACAWSGRKYTQNLFVLQYLLSRRNSQLEEALDTLAQKEQLLARQQKHQALNHLAAGLLHEIINPVNNSIQALTYAKGYAKDYAQSCVDTAHPMDLVQEPIDDALSNQYRIEGIIRDLRSYIAEKPESPKVLANIAELVRKSLVICKNELREIELLEDGDEDAMVLCFPGELLQVFVNLVLNATAAVREKHHGQGGRLVIRWEADTLGAEISFNDNGAGIEPELLAAVSDPFVGGEGADRLGLGLSICQTIVKHHGGELLLESVQGLKTAVRIQLPNGAL